MPPLVKLIVEAGPLVAFFAANWLGGIFWGTAIFMAATVAALAISWGLTRKIAVMPLISAGFVGVFGGLTLWLHDDTFIKVKVTLINALFGAALLGGLYFGQLFLKLVMGEAIRMTDEGWRKLGLRYGIFYLFLACLNEVVWRLHPISTLAIQNGWNLGLDAAGDAEWVLFRMPGLHILTLIFGLSQLPLLMKYLEVKDEAEVAKEVDAAAPPTVG